MTAPSLAPDPQPAAHILVVDDDERIRSLLRRFLRGRAAIAVELFCVATTFAMFAFMARYIWLILVRDFLRGSVSPGLTATPTWYIAAAIFAGLVIFLIQLVASALDTVIHGVPEEHIEGE